MTTILMMAVATCAAALITLSRVFGFKRVMKHSTSVDVGFTVLTVAVLGTTLTGALIAVMSGLLMAVFFSAIRAVHGWAVGIGPAMRRAASTKPAERPDTAPATPTPDTADTVPENPVQKPWRAGRPCLIVLD